MLGLEPWEDAVPKVPVLSAHAPHAHEPMPRSTAE